MRKNENIIRTVWIANGRCSFVLETPRFGKELLLAYILLINENQIKINIRVSSWLQILRVLSVVCIQTIVTTGRSAILIKHICI